MMPHDELEERIRAAYAGDALTLSTATRARILARRSAGARVRFTDRRPGPMREWIIAVAATAGFAVLGGSYALHHRPAPGRERALAESALLPAALLAQGSAAPSFPELRPVREIRPGEWGYAVLQAGESFTDTTPVRRWRLARSAYKDIPAWLLLSSPRPGSAPVAWRDSVWLGATDLRQLGRSVEVMGGRGRLTEEFQEHQILRGFTTEAGTTWTVIDREAPGDRQGNGVVLQAGVLALSLRQAALGPAWRGSVALAVWPYYRREVKRWYDLAVVGEERLSVPAGEFDCWKVRLGPVDRDDGRGVFFWISKREQWIVQQAIIGGPQAESRSLLVTGREE
ncbi:MAG TPA: hypothetical protein VG692_01110 [Gemmatimonadales bacterium]|nr:hypothetical protein [Gemmatimonadales bacterium]